MTTPREERPDSFPNDSERPRASRMTFDDVADALQVMREQAGDVSYAEIVTRIARTRQSRGLTGRPARTTVYDCFRRGRARMNPLLVAEIVLALTGDEQQAAVWRRRCQSARVAPAPAQPPARPLGADRPATLPAETTATAPSPRAEPESPGPITPEPVPGAASQSAPRPGPVPGVASAPSPAPEAEPRPEPALPAGLAIPTPAPRTPEPDAAIPAPGPAPADSRPGPAPTPARSTAGRRAAVLACGVVLNLVGLTLAATLDLPIFLDMIGTALAAFALGPWWGALAGVTTSALGVSVNGWPSLAFALVQAVGALVWGYGARRFDVTRSVGRLLVLATAAAAACTVVATPLVALIYPPDALVPEQPLMQQLATVTGVTLPAVFVGNLFYSVVDKMVASLVAAALSAARGSRTAQEQELRPAG